MLLFTPSSSRNHIKKSMLDRTSISSEIASSSKPTTTSSNSDITADNTNKKSTLPFHLFTRSVTKPINISTTKKSPTRLSSASCPQSSIELPEKVRCLYNYNALGEDELCVRRGEYVRILTSSQNDRWLVRRQTNRTSTTIEGWLPGFVLGLKHPNTPPITTNLSPSPLPTSSVSSNSINPF